MTLKELREIITADVIKLQAVNILSSIKDESKIKHINANINEIVNNYIEWAALITSGDNAELKKHHKIFQGGNKKIDKSVLCQSIIPILSCGSNGKCKYCPHCYAANTCVNGLYGGSVTVAWLTWYEIEKLNPDAYFTQVRYELNHTRKHDIRLHVSGDFISEADYNEWLSVVREFDSKRFYTYSKRPYIDHSVLPKNINIVNSCPCGHSRNYGDEKFLETIVNEIKAEYNVVAWICQCGTDTEKKYNEEHPRDRYCGGACKHCLTDTFVVFHEHD